MAKRKKRHHKAGRETSHELSNNPGLDTLNTVMIPYLYRWHNRGHRDYEAHVIELLQGFRLSQEVRDVYTDDLIAQCADSFRALVSEQVTEVFDPYDVFVATDMEIQLAMSERMDQQVASNGIVVLTAGDIRGIAASILRRVEAHRPELLPILTEKVLLDRTTLVAGSYAIFINMLRTASELGGDADENMPAVLYDYWEGKGDAQRLAADMPDQESWRRAMRRAVEYVLREAAISFVRNLKGLSAADFVLHLGNSLKRLDVKGEIAASIDPRFLGSVVASAVEIRRLGGLRVKQDRQMKGFRGSDDDNSPDVTYRIPHNYWPWHVLKVFLRETDWASEHQQSRHEALVSSGSNFYLLGEQFLHELDDTDMLIDDLRVMEEAPLPHPAFLWLLPNGYLATRSSYDESEKPVEAMLITLVDDNGRKGLSVDFFHHEQESRNFLKISRVFPFDDDGVLHPDPDHPDEFSANTLKLILKILASMAAEPKIVECEVVTGTLPAKKRKKRGREFRTPRVIGWKVRYVRTGSGHKRHGEKGHVVSHWRRRHIRRVPYGPRNVPLHERPRRIVVVARTRVNSEYEKTNAA